MTMPETEGIFRQLGPSQARACDWTGDPDPGQGHCPLQVRPLLKSPRRRTPCPQGLGPWAMKVYSACHTHSALLRSSGSVHGLNSQARPTTAWPAPSPAVLEDGVTAAGLCGQRAAGEPVRHPRVSRLLQQGLSCAGERAPGLPATLQRSRRSSCFPALADASEPGCVNHPGLPFAPPNTPVLSLETAPEGPCSSGPATMPLQTRPTGHQTAASRCPCLCLSWAVPWIPTGAEATLGLLEWDLSVHLKDARVMPWRVGGGPGASLRSVPAARASLVREPRACAPLAPAGLCWVRAPGPIGYCLESELISYVKGF